MMDNAERDQLISQMVADGQSLSEVQKVLQQEHKVNITYMELRLLAADLQLNWNKLDAAKKKPEPEVAKEGAEVDGESADGDAGEAGAATGQTVVNVSPVVRPGAMYSGDVTFASGVTAEWYLDEYGRLGLTNESGQPNENDVMEFQQQLQQKLQPPMG